MKIIYLHQYFATPSMAGGTRSFEFARRFVAWGHEVHVVTSRREGEADRTGWCTTVDDGIHVHWVRVPYSNNMAYLRRIISFTQFALKSARRTASLGGDVVFATSTPLTIALPAIYAARKNHVPMVFEVRDLWPSVPIALGILRGPLAVAARLLERFAYRNAAEVIALSPGMADGVISTGYPENHVHTIPNAADLDLFSVDEELGQHFRDSHKWLGERPLVVYTGAIGAVNGVGYLAELAARVINVDPEVRFLVVGTGKEENAVRATAKRIGVLDRNFYLLDPCAKSEIPAIFSAATIVTSLVIPVPELWNNSANKFFDGLAAGRPIAINYEGWQAELLREHDAGVVLSARDLDDAARQLLTTLRDKEWLVTAGQAARALAESHFSRDDLARRVLDVLRGCSGNNVPAGSDS